MRRRECANADPHRFTTFEIHSAPFNNVRPRVGRYAKAREEGIALWQRDAAILQDPRSSRQLAKVYGLHPGHIRRIRRMRN